MTLEDRVPVKPLVVSLGDTAGGASRAAFRLHATLRSAGVDSRMVVRVKRSDAWHVVGPRSEAARAWNLVRQALGERLARRSDGAEFRSLNVLPSRWHRLLERTEGDVVNLHWIGGEALAVGDIGKISKPIVWTLHDMWTFCGAEHYADTGPGARWRRGYDAAAEGLVRWPDVDRWVWRRKVRAWRTPIRLIAPSRWLAGLASESFLARGWPIDVIPNPLDTVTFQPLGREWARKALGLPEGRPVILFGAIRAARDRRKGLDLLLEALRVASARLAPLDPICAVFGQSAPREAPRVGMELRWMGAVHDEVALALLYSAADVTVVPSRQENLPQTATEAAACGCPVVAFDTGGLPDAVEHGRTGYLARPFQPEDLAHGIASLLEDETQRRELGRAARERALRLWSPEIVVPAYLRAFSAARAAGKGQ